VVVSLLGTSVYSSAARVDRLDHTGEERMMGRMMITTVPPTRRVGKRRCSEKQFPVLQ